MTEKQIERIQKKIADIKRILAAEKRKFGDYDDSRGLRYMPPKYFVQLGDYEGGLKYLKWFQKSFPDDFGFPDFLFECTIILFKTGKLKQAEKKAIKTYTRNTYLFDKFFGRKIVPIDKWENYIEMPSAIENFSYSAKQPALTDFSEWLQEFTSGEKFISFSEKFIELQKKLNTEKDREIRGYIILQEKQMMENF